MANSLLYIRINGTDITDWIAENGIKWSRNDVEAPDAGRTLDGMMQRDRVAIKIRMDVKTVPLTTAQMQELQTLLSPVYITVDYHDLIQGQCSKVMYSNNIETSVVLAQKMGNSVNYLWGECTFPLIER